MRKKELRIENFVDCTFMVKIEQNPERRMVFGWVSSRPRGDIEKIVPARYVSQPERELIFEEKRRFMTARGDRHMIFELEDRDSNGRPMTCRIEYEVQTSMSGRERCGAPLSFEVETPSVPLESLAKQPQLPMTYPE